MEPRTVKDRYGDKITIYGSLDVIDGLLAYDSDALEEYITQRFAIYAPGGGFIYNTGHFVQPDIRRSGCCAHIGSSNGLRRNITRHSACHNSPPR